MLHPKIDKKKCLYIYCFYLTKLKNFLIKKK